MEPRDSQAFASILIGIIVGYVLVSIMAAVLPTTFTYVDDADATVEATKSWVLNWDKVASASWFAVPEIMPVKWVFDAKAIVLICIMFIVTAVETVGDISGITEGGLGREATDKELSGGVMCDGLGSSLAAVFGVLPNTSFSQNVGLVAMNKVVNRFSIATGGIFLIACGLFPKLAALISIMPQSVLGGAAVMMFSSIASQRYPADHQVAGNSEKRNYRFCCTWTWLWTWCKFRSTCTSSTGDHTDFRWLWNRACSTVCNRSEYCASAG